MHSLSNSDDAVEVESLVSLIFFSAGSQVRARMTKEGDVKKYILFQFPVRILLTPPTNVLFFIVSYLLYFFIPSKISEYVTGRSEGMTS